MSTMQLHRKGADDFDSVNAWDGDVLGRKDVAKKLTDLVAGLRGSFVLSIEGSYGEGKTFFLRHWQKDLQEQEYITAYFNSWESDYTDDPFLPFLTCLEQAIGEHKTVGVEGKAKSFWKKSGDLAKKTIPGGSKILAKGLLRYALGDSGMDELKDLVDGSTEEDMISSFGDAVGDALNQQVEQQKSLELFRDNLKAAVEELTSSLDDDKKKIIILVDELDRCNPTYAVKVLERIKHFFDVDGLVFVLGINEKQVANSMSAVYGQKLDTEGYLRRFIHWRFKLPVPSAPEYANLLVTRFALDKLPFLQRNHQQNFPLWMYYNFEVLAQHFGIVSEALSLTLREQEQAFTAVNLFLRTLAPDNPPYGAVIGTLAPLWMVKNRVAQKKRANQPSSTDLSWGFLIDTAIRTNQSSKDLEPNSNLAINNIDNLFNPLYVQIDRIHGLKRMKCWADKPTFEGAFSAWFIAGDKINATSRLCQTDYRGPITDEDKKNTHRHDELRKINHDLIQSPQRHVLNTAPSIAELVWKRLDDNSQLLIQSSSEMDAE